MIHADLRGKLRPDGTNAHDRSEDLLTSTVFGMLRYLPLHQAIVPLMSRVRPASVLIGDRVADVDASLPWIDMAQAASCSIEFWPSFGTYGQPDLLLAFRDAIGTVFHLVTIEVKLFSPKSGDASDAEEDEDESLPDDEPAWNPDQLVRYWRGLAQHPSRAAQTQRSLVYLTAHPSPPLRDLASSLGACPQMRLGWISWRDVWKALAAMPKGPSPSPAEDLLGLLANRGFGDLDAFRSSPPAHIPSSGFWQRPGWFLHPGQHFTVPAQGFWEAR